MTNKFFRLLCSLPIILVTLYFLPFLGVCLLLFRFYLYKGRTNFKTSFILLILGLVLLLPKYIDMIFNLLKVKDLTIPYLDTIITSDIYPNVLKYADRLITIGVIFLILSFIFRQAFSGISAGIKNYMVNDLNKDYEIRKANDLKMQEKREAAKNTHVVHCPYCGSDNMLTSNTGICSFCRRRIEYKN